MIPLFADGGIGSIVVGFVGVLAILAIGGVFVFMINRMLGDSPQEDAKSSHPQHYHHHHHHRKPLPGWVKKKIQQSYRKGRYDGRHGE